MARTTRLAALSPPQPSFQFTGTHTSASLITLKAKTRAIAGGDSTREVPPVSPNHSLPPAAPHSFLICFFLSLVIGRASLCPTSALSLNWACFPFWSERD